MQCGFWETDSGDWITPIWTGVAIMSPSALVTLAGRLSLVGGRYVRKTQRVCTWPPGSLLPRDAPVNSGLLPTPTGQEASFPTSAGWSAPAIHGDLSCPHFGRGHRMLFSCPKGTWLLRGEQLDQNYRPSRDTGPSTCPCGSLIPLRALHSASWPLPFWGTLRKAGEASTTANSLKDEKTKAQGNTTFTRSHS